MAYSSIPMHSFALFLFLCPGLFFLFTSTYSFAGLHTLLSSYNAQYPACHPYLFRFTDSRLMLFVFLAARDSGGN